MMTASIRSREIAHNLHHADEVHHVEDEKEKEEDPEDPATPVLPEKAPSESLRLHRRIHACRNNQQRSCGKVGRARHSAEDRITLAARQCSASSATSWDIWPEIVLIVAPVGIKERSEQPDIRST